MQWSLIAVVLIVNALFGASCASAENNKGQISSVFEAFGYSPACVASALTSCEFSSTKELSVDVVDSIEVTKALLQEMKSEISNSMSEIKSIRQELKSAVRQEMQSERENSTSVLNSLFQEIKSAVENSSSVANSLLQEMQSERENSASVLNSLIQEIKSEGVNERKSFETLLDNIENITHRISSLEISHQEMKSDRENISKSLTSTMAPPEKMNPHKNCADLRELLGKEFSGGVQTVYPYFPNPKPVVVFCDQVTDGGGWTVIQSRSPLPIRENFHRNWTEYVEGFGDLEGEFWIGLDNIHALTNSAKMELRIDLEDAEGKKAWALYSTFHVGDAASKYVLTIGNYSGDAGDGMIKNNERKFSTFDKDNDFYSELNCAEIYEGGWWFHQCQSARLNGLPTVGKTPASYVGIIWYPFRGWYHSLKKASMRIRPVSHGF